MGFVLVQHEDVPEEVTVRIQKIPMVLDNLDLFTVVRAGPGAYSFIF